MAGRASNVALITGISGQDGTYLAELLLERGYVVHGTTRSPYGQTYASEHLANLMSNANLVMHPGDLLDYQWLVSLMCNIRPTEVYHLAAQSNVKDSYDMPRQTAQATGLGVLNMLEAIREAGLLHSARFFQASTCELYNEVPQLPISEATPFNPVSPYAVAKQYGHWIVRTYRDVHGMHACNGILFNHESPRRGQQYVTRKITASAARISAGLQECVELGCLDAVRDWGHAREYVRCMWLMLQHGTPGDYVVATGRAASVREFAAAAFAHVGLPLAWSGCGLDEVGVVASGPRAGAVVVRVSREHFRPSETNVRVGDPSKAVKLLGWDPTATPLEALIAEMVDADLARLQRYAAPASPSMGSCTSLASLTGT